MWIILKSKQVIPVNGASRTFNPGDWVDIGKQTALLWISQGNAELPHLEELRKFVIGGSGVVTDHKELLCKRIQDVLRDFPVEEGVICLPFDRTVWIDSTLVLRIEMIPIGLMMLDTWEMVVPLLDYKTLAIHDPNEREKETTRAVIRDLRVPLYDTRFMFIKRTITTEALIDQWRSEGKTSLGFLRAVYKHKPFILPVPNTWTQGRPPVM